MKVRKKQRKVRSDKGKPRKDVVLSRPFSIKLEPDILEYINRNQGSVSKNRLINDLLRKALGNEIKQEMSNI